ncbi:MAG: ATP-binding cassette domain-containing protein [Planctomycetaceae bacterium]|nr:ATP-binding cassette domain-containing protein [Planctomycetaceae bacterium]
MIAMDNLTKRFGKSGCPALGGITAAVQPGRMTGLVGPDGAGKTTLLRLIAGLLEPSAGSIRAFDVDVVRETQTIRQWLGYMPQRFGLYEDLTVQENLNLYADLQGISPAQRKARFAELLRFTNLERFTGRLARRLSGGMKQKFGLACVLVKMPKLLLLDEPSVGVDPISRRDLWKMVRELVAGEVIVIWSTAYLDEAEACDDVLLLNEGKMLFFGKPDELTARMQNRVVQVRGLAERERRRELARLLQLPEVIDGTVQGSALRIVLQEGKALRHGNKQHVVPVSPRFEDAFIDLLGGMPQGDSPLTARMRTVPESDQPVVVTRGLTKRFGNFTAVRDNHFAIRRGEIFGLLGPNGAGKSTVFKMLCGLLKPTGGEGFIAGHNLLKSPSQARSRLGYMAQKFSLYGDLNVRQNLSFFAGTYGLKGKAKREAVESMIDMFDLAPFVGTNAGLLPLGFKQRLSLACALMPSPDVLFLDEPTSGVDPLTRREFWGHINALVEKGVTVLVTTHFLDEAEYCDRVALIYRGKTIAEGTPDALKQSVQSETLPDPTLNDAFVALIERTQSD